MEIFLIILAIVAGLSYLYHKNHQSKRIESPESMSSIGEQEIVSDSMASDSGQDMFDALSKKTFYRAEATYRHQQIVLPRYHADSGIPLQSIMEQIVPETIPQITDLTIVRTVQCGDLDKKYKYVKDKKDILAYDLFGDMFWKNDEGEFLPVTGTNITLVIRTAGEDVPPYLILFARGTAIAYEATYIRISIMGPTNLDNDDLRTSKSNSTPLMTSFLIACDKKDDLERFADYEEAEQRVLAAHNQGNEQKNEVDEELLYGLFEFKPNTYYYGYGKWLFEQERYYDAYVNFMRVMNTMKPDLPEASKYFYEMCKLTARCLMKFDSKEMAGYYYSLAYSGGEDIADEYADYLAALGDVRALSISTQKLMDEAAIYGSQENWPQSEKDRVFDILVAYKKACDSRKETFKDAVFCSNMSIGFVLRSLLNINANNVSGMSVTLKDGETSTIQSVWDESFYKYLTAGTTMVLPYSRAYYATGETVDKSILCHASSIVIRVDQADVNKNLVRVSIMIPNFNNDDDKHEFTEVNVPVGISFIMSSDENPKLENAKEVESVINYANQCSEQKRFVEALMALEYVYNVLSSEYLGLAEEKKSLLYESAYNIGFCYEELLLHELAMFYLDYASRSKIGKHIQEYINALTNYKDPRALDVIREVQKAGFGADPESGEYKFHFAFLKRREAYVLIDKNRLDEAEVLLKEMLNDPECKDFAEDELDYIAKIRKQQKS